MITQQDLLNAGLLITDSVSYYRRSATESWNMLICQLVLIHCDWRLRIHNNSHTKAANCAELALPVNHYFLNWAIQPVCDFTIANKRACFNQCAANRIHEPGDAIQKRGFNAFLDTRLLEWCWCSCLATPQIAHLAPSLIIESIYSVMRLCSSWRLTPSLPFWRSNHAVNTI